MKLSDLTTLGIGGPIQGVIKVKSHQELKEAIRKLPADGKGFLLLGGGSNLLVSDSGYPGIVIKNEVTGIIRDKNNLTVQSGTNLQDLVDFANSSGLCGLENLAGIPGTVGGAIYGNAGAYGQAISDHLESVKVFDVISYQILDISKHDCQFSYRNSVFKRSRYAILETVFSLSSADSKKLKQISKETIKKREVKYSPGIKCPGSFFQNIPIEKLPAKILAKLPKEFILFNKVSAGALLESVGAKGAKRGDIKIAPYHANLFINDGTGKAEDFYKLAREYQGKVYEKYGIKLEPEVQLINFPPLV
ncbi:UDP-N-acetylmuramate dehydrogenase [Candidatus Daviesbacteria bacterium]|nr:UDP-N-acetylmuramate dehydrogenase [Candidatus Daviesbacteria bacterium]